MLEMDRYDNSIDPKKLDKIPAIFVPCPNTASCDSVLLYFHANAEDLKRCLHLCLYLAATLKVEDRLIPRSTLWPGSILAMDFIDLKKPVKKLSTEIPRKSMIF